MTNTCGDVQLVKKAGEVTGTKSDFEMIVRIADAMGFDIHKLVPFGAGGTTGQLGTGQVNLSSGAALAFDRSDVMTVANVIAGAGSTQQIGTGTTVLTGANTYTGPTQISAGTLQIGNGGTTGSIGPGGVAISAGGALAFDHANE